jgi:hypothetical protein
MKISRKLLGISLGSVAIVSGLVVSLLFELKSESTGSTYILQGPVQEAQAALQAQVDFNLQVQQWNNILLRGDNPDALATYTAQFHQQEAKVKAEVATLEGKVDDPATKQVLSDFLTADDALSTKYQAAYNLDVKQNFDTRAADKLVGGQDRAPASLFDKVTTQLNARVVTAAAAQRAETTRQLTILLFVVGGLLIVDSIVYCGTLLGILKRLGRLKAVSDRLAVADIKGLSIDISGNDEIGEIGESIKGVAAAIEELLAVHAH